MRALTSVSLAALFLLAFFPWMAEAKNLRDIDLAGPADAADLRIEGGTFEKAGNTSGWRSSFAVGPPDYKRKDGVVLNLDPRKALLAGQGTIAFWIYRSSEVRGSNYNTVLFLDGDNTSVFSAYVTWKARHSGASDNVTALRLGGDAYIGEGASVFGRDVLFDRKVSVGEWAHLAITWGPNGPADNKILLNGKEAVAYLGGGVPAARTGNFGKYIGNAREAVIGSSSDGLDTFYQGLIGAVSLYDTIETNFDLSRHRPTIRSVSDDFLKASGISGKLVAGDTITVTMEADPGGKATCDVGSVSGIPMTEDAERPGTYTAAHVIQAGEFLERGRVTGRFANAAGAEAEPAASDSGDISIDSRSRFALIIDRPDLPADSASKARVKVKVTDANGNPVKDHRIKVTLSTTDEYTGLVGGGSPRSRDVAEAVEAQLAGAEVETRWKGITDAWGEVEFDFTAGFAAKTVILQAKDLTSGDVGADYITSYKEASIDIALTQPISRAAGRRGNLYILKVEASRTELTADGRSRSVVRATLMDPNGAPVAGDPVTFALSSENGSLRTIRGTTDASGVATAEYVAGKRIGIVVVTATATLRNASGNVSIILLADAPAKIYLKARPEILPADGFSRADIAVKVTDVNDNPNKDTKVEFRVAKGGGKLDAAERVTDTFGDANNRYTAGTTPGIASVVATVRSRVPTEEELAKARNVLFVPYSEDGEEIRVEKWLKRVGDTALKGEAVVEYTIGRDRAVRQLAAPYDCRIEFQYVEYWDTAQTGDTLALVSPVTVPGTTGVPPPPVTLSPRRR